MRKLGVLRFPKDPKIRINIIGNIRLNTMAIGCANMAAKLALVIAQRAFDWLYGFGMKESWWANLRKKIIVPH